MSNGVVTINGYWDIKLYGEDGALKQSLYGKNVITTVGKEALANYLASAAASATRNPFYFIAIGTGGTAETAADTAMAVEAARVSGTASFTGGTAIYEVTATFAAGVGTGAIVEYGLFNTSTGGTLFSRDTEAVVNKSASDSLVVITQVTLS
jgi:hypothetical protein